MKVTFLGTSHGVPAPDRYCQSMLIETENSGYVVDAGAPVIECLLRRNFDLRKLKAVFFTHMHSDHTCYMFGLLMLACWYFKDMDFDVYLPEGVQEVTDFIMMCFGKDGCTFPNERIRIHLMEGEGSVYQDEYMKVTAYHTDHLENEGHRPAYGYLMEDGKKRLYISGDLSYHKIDYPEFLNEEMVDTFIVECAHFPAEKLMEKLKVCKAGQVLPVHVAPVAKYETLRRLEGGMPFKMAYPKDGETYEV